MSQANKKGSSWGILTRLTGTLALSTVLGLGFGGCLVLKVPNGIGTPYTESFPVIHLVSDAALLNPSSSWTWNGSAELADNSGIALDFPVGITGADVTAFGGKGRQDEQ